MSSSSFIASIITEKCLGFIGFLRFHPETDEEKLWIPKGSPLQGEFDWLKNGSGFPNYKHSVRISSLIVVHPNLLSPDILAQLTFFHREIDGLRLGDVGTGGGEVGAVNHTIPLNFTVSSVLSLWNSDADVIAASSAAEIETRVRSAQPLTRQLLGGDDDAVSSSRSGSSSSSSSSSTWPRGVNATIMRWIFDSDDLTAAIDGDAFDIALENTFTRVFQRLRDADPRFRVFFRTHDSFARARDNGVNEDYYLVGIAYGAVFLFVIFNLGAFTKLRHKLWLSTAGIACVGMAWAAGAGVASAIGLDWGIIHPIIAFLLLGIGIDDMFVIVQAYQNNEKRERRDGISGVKDDTYGERELDSKLDEREKRDRDPEFGKAVDRSSYDAITLRVASSLRQVGVSITVTTVTDVVAFAIGAVSQLPVIQSFSIWLAVGMFAVYLLQVWSFLL